MAIKNVCDTHDCKGKAIGARRYSWTPPQLNGRRVDSWTNLCQEHMVMWTRAVNGLPPLEPTQQALKLEPPTAVQDAINEAAGQEREDSDRGFERSTG